MRSGEAAVLGEQLRRDGDGLQGASLGMNGILGAASDAEHVWLEIGGEFKALYQALTEAFPEVQLVRASPADSEPDIEDSPVLGRPWTDRTGAPRPQRSNSERPEPGVDEMRPAAPKSPRDQARPQGQRQPQVSYRFTHTAGNPEDDRPQPSSVWRKAEPPADASGQQHSPDFKPQFASGPRAESEGRPFGGLRDLAWDLQSGLPAPAEDAPTLLGRRRITRAGTDFPEPSPDTWTRRDQLPRGHRSSGEPREAITQRSSTWREAPESGQKQPEATQHPESAAPAIDIDDLMDALVERIERDYRRFYGG